MAKIFGVDKWVDSIREFAYDRPRDYHRYEYFDLVGTANEFVRSRAVRELEVAEKDLARAKARIARVEKKFGWKLRV